MEKEPVTTVGVSPSAGKSASIVDLTSLASATAHILTALQSEEELPAVSAESPSKTSENSSSVQVNVQASLTTEVVTTPEIVVEVTKTKEKIMKTKKPKAEKKMTVARMLQRLDKVQTFKRLSVKMTRWLEDEKDEARKADLTALRARFDAIISAQEDLYTATLGLQNLNYVPPKKNFSGTMQLEKGRHVWVKPKFAEAYTVAFGGTDAMENLFVDQTVGGKVVVSVGTPDEVVAFKLPIPKLHLQVTPNA